MAQKYIKIRGARQHNLKNIDVDIPREQLVVITGLSGSGKSSLAFDTIYAEGQRRYVESLSAYARQFLGQMDKPDLDLIEGLSPAISIDQKSTIHNPRSTVGTVTEIYDYLRLLFARIGLPHCPHCNNRIRRQTVDEMVDQLLKLPENSRILILAPLVRGRKGEHRRIIEDIQRQGFVRIRVDGKIRELTEEIKLEKNKKHTVEVVVDRLRIRDGIRKRLADSLELTLGLSDGLVQVSVLDGEELTFSQKFACPACGFSFEELSPRLFSFNSPYGACPECTGLGTTMEIDPELVIPDMDKSIAEGAIAPFSRSTNYFPQILEALASHYGFSTEVPLKDLDPKYLKILLEGNDGERFRVDYQTRWGDQRIFTTDFEGVIPILKRRYRESQSQGARSEYEEYMNPHPCPACQGKRLRPEALAVTVAGKNIATITKSSVAQAHKFFSKLRLSERDRLIAERILKEIQARLGFLLNVGLDYLTLDRVAGSLSGGEAQRIRLATQIGSGLTGVLYILDEPTIGLHQRDNQRLLKTLKDLRDLGNTIIVVEHDAETMAAADFLLDIGPGAGEQGGYLVATGSPEQVKACSRSITGQYLSGKRSIPVPFSRRQPGDQWLEVVGAAEHNLKNIDVKIPIGLFVCVTGVSGSGKSTLVNNILYRQLAQDLHQARKPAGRHREITGREYLDKVIAIDQAPIGRTPRSNSATYTGAFDPIRELFSLTADARMRGYKPGRFSFNVRGGRCEACRGDGILKIEMHFLPDVYVPCEVCKGQRYNRETLEIKYKGKNIADVLNMTVTEALSFFAHIPRVANRLQALSDVGLGYIKLGQPATTLSGGEAQRVKLATELSRRSTGRTLYILDEPTTGLHFADIEKLVRILQRLVDGGNTVVVIEHNLDVIKAADYVIDLGPEGGEKGGQLLAVGTPEEICRCENSYTGQFLRPLLEKSTAPAELRQVK
ncbi:MAG: excinuclease ABC subunit UvrA [Firmicutes bacterium]|nr:excinuclease ABC subunit UvrA [Bacillota bacterium]